MPDEMPKGARPTSQNRRAAIRIMAGAALFPRAAAAQSSPPRIAAAREPIRIIVPYPPGGPTDAIARLIGNELQNDLNASVVVENKAGAAGAVGTREVARAAPDGRTLVLGTNQTHITNAVLLKDPGYKPFDDFVAVAGLADLQHALVVPKTAGQANVADLVARAKAAPWALNYGSSGVGSGSHLAMELFMARTGTRMTHVAFRGAAPMALEIVASRIDCAFATLPSVLGQIQGGEMVALALASRQHAPQLPLLSLLSEQGVRDSEGDAWLALFAPRATPAASVAALSNAITTAMRRSNVAAQATKLGMAVNVRDSAAFATYFEAETGKWLEVVRRAGVKAE